MTHASTPDLRAQMERLQARCRGELPDPAPCAERIAAEVYTDEGRFAAERERLFLKRPLIIAHESQIPEPGDAIVYDWLGLPLITLRDRDGTIGTFMNACRHRGMRLVQDEGRTCLRSLVCPYHQWTYGLDGALRNIPRNESFGKLDTTGLGLVRLPTEVRQGLVWMQATPGETMDLDAHLAGLGRDLELFEMPGYHFCEQHIRTVDCNWKLVQDAFLDGYHIVRLHKKTVGPFFPDALTETDDIGDHIRSAVARNELLQADCAADELDLRHHCTFSYTVFPNAVLVLHPDYTSIISLFPLGPHQTVFAHTMLTPGAIGSDAEREHYRRSFELVDQGVFQAEDIFVSEGAHRSLRSGATRELLFGGLEESAVRFHRTIEQELAAGA